MRIIDRGYLSDILDQLDDLRNEDETDDYGILRATQHAYETAGSILRDAGFRLRQQDRWMPRGVASTDATGGVRIDWVRRSGSVAVVVPATADRKPYVCRTDGGSEALISFLADTLYRFLAKISVAQDPGDQTA